MRFLLCLCLVGLASCGVSVGAPQSSEPRTEAPDFRLPDTSGGTLALSELRGKVVLLNFWAPWCFSCKEEMVGLQQLHDYFENESFTVLAVTVLEDGQTLATQPYTFPVLRDEGRQVAKRYSVGMLPVTIVIDKEGRIAPFPDPSSGEPATVFVGPRGWSSLRVTRAIQALIEE